MNYIPTIDWIFMSMIHLLKNRKDYIKVFVHFLKLDVKIIYFEIYLSATGHNFKQLFKIWKPKPESLE